MVYHAGNKGRIFILENSGIIFLKMNKLSINPNKDPILRVFKKVVLLSTEFDDFEKKNLKKRQSPLFFPDEKTSNWKLFFTVMLALISLLAICFAVFYTNLNDKAKKDEIAAAEAISDVAMALTYAQINHINPLTQNWSNPEFLRNNFSAIVPPDCAFLADIDSHGKFNNCPYILRIYTNNDFSNFLVVALPEATLLQWLIPKSAIFVHSETMELRKIEDLRALNRLLVNPHTLNGANGQEITNLVKNGTLIPLTYLSAETKNLGFAPPKALALRRPGAENLIHNAPRYYQFSETYVERALNLNKSSENSREDLAKLQQEIAHILKLPNLILYSSDGIEAAIQAEKAFSTFIPFGKFLNGYVIFDTSGIISGSRLVMEEDYKKPYLNLTTEIAKMELSKDAENQHMHPAEFQLLALSSARSQALASIAKEINLLLDSQIQTYNPKFGEKLADLAIQFQQKDIEEKEKIGKVLTELYEGYSDIPLAHMLPHTKSAGLEHIVAEMLLRQSENLSEENLSQELIGAQLQMIKKAKTFAELDESATKAVNLLSLKLIPNPEQLIAYQNETKGLVTEKLEEFLLSSKSPMDTSEFTAENRNLLNHILEISWIHNSHETSFYLNEFDLL